MKKFNTQKKILYVFILAFGCLAFFIIVTYTNLLRATEESRENKISFSVLKSVESLYNNIQDFETGYRHFLLTGNKNFLDRYHAGLANYRYNLDTINSAGVTDAEEVVLIARLNDWVEQKIIYGKGRVEAVKPSGKRNQLQNIYDSNGKFLMDSIRKYVFQIEEIERANIYSYNTKKKETAKNTLLLFLTFSGIAILSFLAFYFIIRRNTNRNRKSEERITYLAKLIDQTDEAIFSTNTTFIIKTWNKGAERIYGFGADEAIGKTVDGLLQTNYGEVPVEKLVDDFRRLGYFNSEVIQKNKAGDVLYILVTSSALYDEDGVQIGAVAINKDITERKRLEVQLKKLNEEMAERKLAESENRLRAIFETEPDCIKLLDRDTHVLEMNPAGFALIEADRPEQVIGKNVIHLVDEKYRSAFLQLIHEVFEGSTGKLEFSITGFKGAHLWMETHAVPMRNQQGEIVSVLSISRDVTERKKAEEELKRRKTRFRALIENSHEAISMVNESGEIIYRSPAAEKMTGFSQEDIQGKRSFDFIHPEDLREAIEFYETLKKEPGVSKPKTHRVLHKDGHYIWTEGSVTNLLHLEDVQAIVSNFHDITERKRAEEELRNSSSLLKATLESTTDGILVVDRRGKITGYNGQFVNMWNIPDEVLHSNDDERALNFAIDQLKDPVSFSERVKELYNHPEVVSFDTFELKDRRTFERYSQPQRMNNEIVGRVWSFRDITKRILAEEETRKISNQLAEVSAAVPGVVYQFKLNVDGHMSFPYVSDGIYELSGLKPEDVYEDAMAAFSRVVEEDLPGLFESIKTSAITLEPWFYIFRVKDINNPLKWIRGNSIPRKLADGVILWNGTLIDISDLKAVENELKASELRYRSLIEQASDAILITDQSGNFIDVNESFCRMFGLLKEELLQMNVSEVIDPEELKSKPIQFDILAAGQHVFNERKMLHRNGTIIEVEANVKMLPDGRLLAIVRDITERKKVEDAIRLSEQKYKLLFFKNPLPMMMISIPEMRFIDVNEASIEQYGYSKDEFLAMTANDIRPGEDIGLFQQTIEKMVEGINHFGIWRHLKKNGNTIQVEVIAHKIMYEDNPAWLILANDVTEKKLAESKLNQSYKELRQLTNHLQTVREDERTNIAREIHDELGQQLTGLKMDASWLIKKIPSENTIVHDKIAGMISLIDDTVKTVRHISSELRPGILDDLGLVDALDWQSNEFEKRTGIRCKFNSKSAEVQFEKNLSTGIFRVFQETLTNVARHAQATEIKTTLEQDDDRILLSVHDNGKGFDQTEIESKNTLGLVGMKERASMFGGKLTISSSKGKGTSILLHVPLKISDGKTDPEK